MKAYNAAFIRVCLYLYCRQILKDYQFKASTIGCKQQYIVKYSARVAMMLKIPEKIDLELTLGPQLTKK